jgi:hypothetical protein
MRSLVLCQSCKRHVKASETLCPFCSAAVVSRLARERTQGGAVGRGLPGGRAALFLAGTALAAGCADEPEPDALDEGRNAGSDAGTQHARNDAGIAADAGRDPGRDAAILVAQPYGISIDQWRDASIVTPRDAGPSCPQVGNLPVPVYGIAVDSGPPNDPCKDAGPDAASDAGRDAGNDAGKDAGQVISLPPYGIPIDAGR